MAECSGVAGNILLSALCLVFDADWATPVCQGCFLCSSFSLNQVVKRTRSVRLTTHSLDAVEIPLAGISTASRLLKRKSEAEIESAKRVILPRRRVDAVVDPNGAYRQIVS
jgi:hypothetical protein